jgi:formylglycine-generating enzyme required for sulfatase activity
MLTEWPDDGEALALIAGVIAHVQAPLKQRLRAGWLLAEQADPRPGVCALPRGLEDPYWADPIPAGAYPIASGKATARLGAFRVARYPATVWQFRHFVDTGSYTDERWWTPEGWRWLQPGGARHSYKEQGGEITQPLYWDNPDWTAHSQPVVGVSWYEAAAFCAWLDALGHTEGWLPQGWKIRLPTEAEWEVAAMWDAAARALRPWASPVGEIWQNSEEAGIARTCPVGLFLQGASPCGALDMAGNVWEWCASSYKGYPAQATKVRDDFTPGDFDIALRGGSYLQNARSGWSARLGNSPYIRNVFRGFRVAVCSDPPR